MKRMGLRLLSGGMWENGVVSLSFFLGTGAVGGISVVLPRCFPAAVLHFRKTAFGRRDHPFGFLFDYFD